MCERTCVYVLRASLFPFSSLPVVAPTATVAGFLKGNHIRALLLFCFYSPGKLIPFLFPCQLSARCHGVLLAKTALYVCVIAPQLAALPNIILGSSAAPPLPRSAHVRAHKFYGGKFLIFSIFRHKPAKLRVVSVCVCVWR